MEPGAALPPEIYRLDAHRLPLAKGRARRRTSLGLALASGIAAGLLAIDAPSFRAALDTALAVAAVLAVVAPYALWAAGRRVRRSWNAFELGIGPSSLRLAAPGVKATTFTYPKLITYTEQWLHLPSGYLQIKAVEGLRPAERLVEAGDRDGVFHASEATLISRSCEVKKMSGSSDHIPRRATEADS